MLFVSVEELQHGANGGLATCATRSFDDVPFDITYTGVTYTRGAIGF